MTPSEPTAPQPIRRRLTVLRDGSVRAAAIVFCDPERRTVPLSRCAACRFAGPIERDTEGREATIECCRFLLPSSRSAQEPASNDRRPWGTGVVGVAAMLPIGLCLVRPVVCVAHDAPLRIAARALEMEPSAYGVMVVDDEVRLVGILLRAATTLALLHAAADAVADYMSTDWSAVDEARSLGEAFGTMTSRRARELSVVTEEGAVVGTLRDVDALRFVSYVARTGMRPPVEPGV
jgi:CBS domain-containing protein